MYGILITKLRNKKRITYFLKKAWDSGDDAREYARAYTRRHKKYKPTASVFISDVLDVEG